MDADLYMSYHMPEHTERDIGKHAKGLSCSSHEEGILASQFGKVYIFAPTFL